MPLEHSFPRMFRCTIEFLCFFKFLLVKFILHFVHSGTYTIYTGHRMEIITIIAPFLPVLVHRKAALCAIEEGSTNCCL